MLRFISTVFLIVLACLCIWLAVDNREPVTVALGPLTAPPVPLFFVFFAGLALGMIAIALRAGASRIAMGHKLRKAAKRIAALEGERDMLSAERDHLAAQVRPDDDRQKAAQISDIPAAGSLIGPTSAPQSVLPG